MQNTCLVYPERNYFWSLHLDQCQLQLSFDSVSLVYKTFNLQTLVTTYFCTCWLRIFWLLLVIPSLLDLWRTTFWFRVRIDSAIMNERPIFALRASWYWSASVHISSMFLGLRFSKTEIDLCCTLRELDPEDSNQLILRTSDQRYIVLSSCSISFLHEPRIQRKSQLPLVDTLMTKSMTKTHLPSSQTVSEFHISEHDPALIKHMYVWLSTT